MGGASLLQQTELDHRITGEDRDVLTEILAAAQRSATSIPILPPPHLRSWFSWGSHVGVLLVGPLALGLFGLAIPTECLST